MAATSGTQLCGMQQLNPPPKSTNTVKVRMIDTTCVLKLYAEAFLKPVMPGHEIMTVIDVCFLIENPRLGKKAMFDLGVRKDYWNSPPWTIARIEAAIPGVKIDKDVTEILQEKGMKLDEIGRLFVSRKLGASLSNFRRYHLVAQSLGSYRQPLFVSTVYESVLREGYWPFPRLSHQPKLGFERSGL